MARLFRFLLLVAILLIPAALSQFVRPIKNKEDLPTNKYLDRESPSLTDDLFRRGETEERATCAHGFAVSWSTDTYTPIYAPLLLSDFQRVGKADVLVATSQGVVSVLDGETGQTVDGWPVSLHSNCEFPSKPLLYDMDGDGRDEIIIPCNDGRIDILSSDGVPLGGTSLVVPPIRLEKNWYEKEQTDGKKSVVKPPQSVTPPERLSQTKNEEEGVKRERPLATTASAAATTKNTNKKWNTARVQGADGWLTPDARASLDLFANLPTSSDDEEDNDLTSPSSPFYSSQFAAWLKRYHIPDYAKGEKNGDGDSGCVWVDAHIIGDCVIAELIAGEVELICPVNWYFAPEEYEDPRNMAKLAVDVEPSKYAACGVVAMNLVDGGQIRWTTILEVGMQNLEEEGGEAAGGETNEDDVVNIRAAKAARRKSKSGAKIRDKGPYIIGSLAVGDINRDGVADVAVGTAMGNVHILNGRSGDKFTHWSFSMAPIWASVIMDDIVGLGSLQVIAADSRGNLVVISSTGKELWEKQLSGPCVGAPLLADVNGDGERDIVLATSNGHLWALKGKTGEVLDGFPIVSDGVIQSPPIVINSPLSHAQVNEIHKRHSMKGERARVVWSDAADGASFAVSRDATHDPAASSSSRAQAKTIIFAAHDGHLYLVDGGSGCVEKLDIGEAVRAPLVLGDVENDGFSNVLLGTVNGNIECMNTPVAHDLAKGTEYVGVAILPSSKVFRDIVGKETKINFRIIDNRRSLLSKSVHKGDIERSKEMPRKYHVRVTFGRGLSHVILEKTFHEPGEYSMRVGSPDERSTQTIVFNMRTDEGKIYEDAVTLSFNMFFYRILKYCVLAPVFVVVTVVFNLPKMGGKRTIVRRMRGKAAD